jgi:hypothetical protein
MAHRAATVLLAALLVAAVCGHAHHGKRAGGGGGGGANYPNGGVPGSEMQGMPDHTDPAVKKQLECAACNEVAYEAMLVLEGMKRRAPKKGYKDWEVAASMEDLCDANKLSVGLMRDNESKQVKLEYGNEKYKHVVEHHKILKGSWVTPLWLKECYGLVERIEDDLVHIYKGQIRAFKPDFNICPMCPLPTDAQRKEHEERMVEAKAEEARLAAQEKVYQAHRAKDEL